MAFKAEGGGCSPLSPPPVSTPACVPVHNCFLWPNLSSWLPDYHWKAQANPQRCRKEGKCTSYMYVYITYYTVGIFWRVQFFVVFVNNQPSAKIKPAKWTSLCMHILACSCASMKIEPECWPVKIEPCKNFLLYSIHVSLQFHSYHHAGDIHACTSILVLHCGCGEAECSKDG